MPAACLAKRSRFTYPDNVQKIAHRMKLSIVATLYCSAPELPEFYRRCVAAAKEVTDDLEIILVDDGSPDDSLAVALSLQASDHRVVVVELARNFGHHKAMMTGLAHSAGDLVFLIDSDLEEPPEALTAFHAKLTDGGWDVVYGIQRERRGSPFERLTGRAFYAIMDALSDRSIPRDLITARLMRRDYVAALIAHQDRSFQISHLWALTGFRQAALEVEKLALSPSTYTIRRRLRMAIQHITTTSTRILYFIFYGGLMLSMLAVLLMLMGIQLISTGLLAEMLAKNDYSTKQYGIREIHY